MAPFSGRPASAPSPTCHQRQAVSRSGQWVETSSEHPAGSGPYMPADVLRVAGAGDENRTRFASLEGWNANVTDRAKVARQDPEIHPTRKHRATPVSHGIANSSRCSALVARQD